ncbi:MAG: esterase family protein [Ruminococcaceae bacterium]|nr:esterase family protein [Oscillospiraceae bacterium]
MAHLTVEFFSNVLGKCMTMEVILPQSTTTQIGMNGSDAGDTYPVLYLLHGMSDDHSIWLRRTSIERYVSELGIAVVMPNADLSFYTDMKIGGRYWTYLSEELPAICRGFFPRISPKREDTFAAGLSMGGYGAWKLGLRCPEKFAAVASLSGCLDIVSAVKRNLVGNPVYWNSIFGSVEELQGSEDDLLAVAEKTAASPYPVALYACCGTEDFLYRENQTAVSRIRSLGMDLTYEEGPGAHTWEFWDTYIQKILKWLPIRH